MIAMQFAIHFVPDISDFMMPHVQEIFSLLPRVVAASLGAYLISQHHDIWAFHFWKQKTEGKYLWLRNNFSTAVSQLIDSLVFSLGAFWGIFPAWELIQIIITTYVFKVIVALVDTPFIYFARKLGNAQAYKKLD
jgi:uncharacterized integral membrane protein (TIGR00697 family)